MKIAIILIAILLLNSLRMPAKKRRAIAPPISREEEIEYIIYCRKSTDESSNKQVTSIPRQIAECVAYAEREKLNIALKPDNFSMFETETEIHKEDICKDEDDRVTYHDTRHLYIIKEQDSAKTPANRKKWTKLAGLIKEGKVRGLLSYSPDRQARNMLEGGELIDFVDHEILKLRYTNFHFEPTASGKMMLGIWFVFSKQYSDKLSEDVTAGNKRASGKGETLGYLKHGYKRGEDSKWHKDERTYAMVAEAFKLKIEEKWSDSKIARHMELDGFCYKYGDAWRKMTHQKLSKMWTDPFYYGTWIRGGCDPIDLLAVDERFEPMITRIEHEFLCEHSRRSMAEKMKREINLVDDIETIRVMDSGFLLDKDGNEFCVALPNKKKRFFPKLETLQEGNTKAVLADVVAPHQIQLYNNRTQKSISFEKIDKVIREKITHLHMTDEDYLAYLCYAKEKLREILNEFDEERQRHQLQINSLTNQKNDFLTDNLSSKSRDFEEETLYQKKKKEFKDKIEFHENQIKKISKDEEIEIFSTETMIKFMKNAHEYYDKCSYVQKAHIIKILFLNMVYHHEKWLELKVKPDVEALFCLSGDRRGNDGYLFRFSVVFKKRCYRQRSHGRDVTIRETYLEEVI